MASGSLNLKDRSVVPELMDDPALDAAAHAQALEGLRRLNRVSRAVPVIAKPIVAFARRHKLQKLSMLDVACGGGDVAVGVTQLLRARGIAVDLKLCDISGTALARASALAKAHGIEARTVSGSAPHGLPAGPFDIVINTLFLHHLPREAVVETLHAMSQRAARLLVVGDLRRSTTGFLVAWIMCRVMTRSPIVHYDGPVSVRAAWTIDEMREMVRDAGLADAIVRPCLPFRMLITQEKAS